MSESGLLLLILLIRKSTQVRSLNRQLRYFELLFEPLVENLYFLGYYAKGSISEYSTGNDPNPPYNLVVTVSQGSR